MTRWLVQETRIVEYVVEAPDILGFVDIQAFAEANDSESLFCSSPGSDIANIAVYQLNDSNAMTADYADLNADVIIDEDTEIIGGDDVPVTYFKETDQ